MLALDTRAFAAMYGGPQGEWSRAMIGLTIVGGGWAVLALLPLLAWPRSRRFARALSWAIAAQALCVWGVKRAVGRVRPWIALGLPEPFGAPRDGSFPSGHASGIFCAAAFLVVALPAAWRAPRWCIRLVACAWIAFATLVAVSRVYLGAHFPSDVLAGALTGACFGAAAGGVYASRARSCVSVGDE